MGKLFDRTDHLWEMDQINFAEQDANATLTGFQLARLDDIGRSDRFRLERSKTGGGVGAFEKLRRQSRMKLLKTGQLMSDLRVAMAIFRACAHCTEQAGRRRPCGQHKARINGCLLAVKYAGEDNMPTRLAQGRVWGDDEPIPIEEKALNEWEQWYYRDRKEGIWPGDAAWAKREFGSLGYRGWLQMLFEESEIGYADFVAEKARINAANCA